MKVEKLTEKKMIEQEVETGEVRLTLTKAEALALRDLCGNVGGGFYGVDCRLYSGDQLRAVHGETLSRLVDNIYNSIR